MRSNSTYLIGVSGIAIAMLCFVAALEASVVTTAEPRRDSGIESSIDSSVHPRADTVNRALKGDRLRSIIRPAGAEPFDVQVPLRPAPRLLDGCESAVSTIDRSSASKLPARCVT